MGALVKIGLGPAAAPADRRCWGQVAQVGGAKKVYPGLYHPVEGASVGEPDRSGIAASAPSSLSPDRALKRLVVARPDVVTQSRRGESHVSMIRGASGHRREWTGDGEASTTLSGASSSFDSDAVRSWPR